MRNGIRCSLVGLVGAVVLAASPAALGDESTYQLVVANQNGDCFVVQTLGGTLNGCTPRPAGVKLLSAVEYSAAANGSIVFTADDNTDPRRGDQGSIWLVRPNGSSVHLDSSTWDFDPTISYNGSKVTFARFDPTTWSADIYSINSDGSGLQLVASGGETNTLTLPAISPDGSVIAYWCGPAKFAASAGRGCGPLTDGSYRLSGLMRVNSDGTNPRMIVIGPGIGSGGPPPSGLSWSPDGQWLARDDAVTVDLGNGNFTFQVQLFRYRSDGSDLFNNLDPTRQITNETAPHSPAYARFSPDGAELLFEEGNVAYLINVNGTNLHNVNVFGEFVPTATPVAPPQLVDATHITVPSVVNLDLAAATSELQAHNLTVGTVSHAYSATVGANLVASQDPSAGAVAHRTDKTGPPVNLVISRGPPPCVVPGVKGKSLKAAKRAIRAAHCSVGKIRSAISRTVRRGHVISQSPRKGRKLARGAKVALTVSKGRKS